MGWTEIKLVFTDDEMTSFVEKHGWETYTKDVNSYTGPYGNVMSDTFSEKRVRKGDLDDRLVSVFHTELKNKLLVC